jgi:hypothetical protein
MLPWLTLRGVRIAHSGAVSLLRAIDHLISCWSSWSERLDRVDLPFVAFGDFRAEGAAFGSVPDPVSAAPGTLQPRPHFCGWPNRPIWKRLLEALF